MIELSCLKFEQRHGVIKVEERTPLPGIEH